MLSSLKSYLTMGLFASFLVLVGISWWYVRGLQADVENLEQSLQTSEQNNINLKTSVQLSRDTIEAMVAERERLLASQAELSKQFNDIRNNNKLLQIQISNLVESLISMTPSEAEILINKQYEMMNLCIEKTSRGDADAQDVCNAASDATGSLLSEPARED